MATLKSALPVSDSWESFDFRPTIPDIPAVQEVVPLAELLAELIKPKPRNETRGRKPKWPWQEATLAVFGAIYRGEEREPKCLAEIEAMLGDWFIANCDDQLPAESQLREYAKLIWREITKAEN
jgi:hypothetical protein